MERCGTENRNKRSSTQNISSAGKVIVTEKLFHSASGQYMEQFAKSSSRGQDSEHL